MAMDSSAKLRREILASTPMVDAGQAADILGLSTVHGLEGQHDLLGFCVDGRMMYPLFQFDVEHGSIYPVLLRLIALKPTNWSTLRLVNWLLRPHLDFGAPPVDYLVQEPEEVVSAFKREIEPVVHG